MAARSRSRILPHLTPGTVTTSAIIPPLPGTATEFGRGLASAGPLGTVEVLVFAAVLGSAAADDQAAQKDHQGQEGEAPHGRPRVGGGGKWRGPAVETAGPAWLGEPSDLLLGVAGLGGAAAAAADGRQNAEAQDQSDEDPLHLRTPWYGWPPETERSYPITQGRPEPGPLERRVGLRTPFPIVNELVTRYRITTSVDASGPTDGARSRPRPH